MIRSRKFFILLVFAALLRPLGAQSTVNGTWTAELRQGKVFLQVRTSPPAEWNGDRGSGDWNMGQSLLVDEIGGLPRNDNQFTVSNIKFELRREAGTLAFDGAFRDGRGAGLFAFTPRAEYAAEMRALGYTDDLPAWRRFQLAVHDVGPRYIRDLKTEGFDKLPLDLVQRARSHGVTIEYIRDLKAQGFRSATLENLVRTRDHGVTGDYIKAMKAEGFTGASLDELVRLRDHGVTQPYVQEMKKAGFVSATLEDLVRARDHGVTPDFVKEIEGSWLQRRRPRSVWSAAARSRRARRVRPRPQRAGFQERAARGRRAGEGSRRQRRLHRRHERARAEGSDPVGNCAAPRSRDHAGVREPRAGARLQAGRCRRTGAAEKPRTARLATSGAARRCLRLALGSDPTL